MLWHLYGHLSVSECLSLCLSCVVSMCVYLCLLCDVFMCSNRPMSRVSVRPSGGTPEVRLLIEGQIETKLDMIIEEAR